MRPALLLLIPFLTLTACEAGVTSLRVNKVPLPKSSGVVELVSDGNTLAARSADKVFRFQDKAFEESSPGCVHEIQGLGILGDRLWAQTLAGLVEIDGEECRELQLAVSQPAGNRVSGARRFLQVDGQLLYMAHDRMYRADDTGFQEISMQGAEWSDEQELPGAVRSYLPATNARPFEVLTVLRRQLMVYRRMEDSTWMLTATLGSIDLELVGSPLDDTLFILTADLFYRSDDQGEHWFGERLPTSDVLTSLVVQRNPQAPDELVKLISTSGGQIFRRTSSEVAWTEVYSQEHGRLSVESLTGTGATIWGQLEQARLITSVDGGATWQEYEGAFGGVEVRAFDIEDDGNLWIATQSGLYRQQAGQWVQEMPRSMMSVFAQGENILAGGAEGLLFSKQGDQWQAMPRLEWANERLEFAAPCCRHGTEESIVWVERAHGMTYLWTRGRGAYKGETAYAPVLVAALAEVLSTGHVSGFALTPDGTLHLAGRLPGSTSAQYWRSSDGGLGWSSTRAFEIGDGPGDIFLKASADVLYLVHGSRLSVSYDQGSTWHELDGPWEYTGVYALAAPEGRLFLLSMVPPGELYVLDDRGTLLQGRYLVRGLPAHTVVDMKAGRQELLLLSGGSLYEMPLPSGRVPLGQGAFLLVVVVFGFIGILISFFILRRASL